MARSSANPTGDLGFRPVKRALVIEHDEHGPAEGVGDHLVERGYQLDVFRVMDDPADPACTKPYPDGWPPPEGLQTTSSGCGLFMAGFGNGAR